MIRFVLAAAVLLSSCAARRVSLLPPQPDGADPSAPNWVDLGPGMELRIQGAYYREGSASRGVSDYLGNETATYEVRANGSLRLDSATSLREQPRDQPAVQLLIGPRNLSYRYHRLFFQVVMSRAGRTRPAVLLGARSMRAMDSMTARFLAEQNPGCGGGSSSQCTAFPSSSTAAVAITIVVNGASRKVIWGSTLGSIAARARHIELLRVSNGRLAPVPIDAADPEVLRMPLLHGDQVNWD